MSGRTLIRSACGLLALAAGATSVAADEGRGKLLYETHCIACHTTQLHWRAKRQASDWSLLLAQVTRWQAEARLGWSPADIEAVARHLNETVYHHRLPQQRAGAAVGPVARAR